MALKLLDAGSETGDWLTVPAGLRELRIYGTWDGATVKLQATPDGGTTAIDVVGASFTANAHRTLDVPIHGMTLRAHVASAGASTAVTVEVN